MAMKFNRYPATLQVPCDASFYIVTMPSRRRQRTGEEDELQSQSDSSAGPSTQKTSTQGQSKRDRSQRHRHNDSDEEDSSDAAPAPQRKSKSTQKATEKMSKQDQDSRAWDILRLALCAEFTRKPLTRNEINKEILGEHSRQFKDTMTLAQTRALQSLGMELVELRAKDTGFGVEHEKKAADQKKKKKSKRQRRDSDESDSEQESENQEAPEWSYVPGKQYILRSAFDQDTIARAANPEEWPEESNSAVINVRHGDQLSHIGILYIILSLILVSGRELPDDHLRSYFKKLDVLPNTDLPINSSTAPSTASTKLTLDGLLQTFTKQGYLERIGTTGGRSRREQHEADAVEARTGSGGGGDPNLSWRWGARADGEIGETNIGHFIETFFEESADVGQTRRKEISDNLWKNMGRAAGNKLQVAQPLQNREKPRDES